MQSCEKGKRLVALCKGVRVDTQLVMELADGCPCRTGSGARGNDTRDVVHFACFTGCHTIQWMAAACICPDTIKGNLARCALLEEQSVVRIKEEYRKGSVQETWLAVKTMGIVFGGMASDGVIFRDEDDVVMSHKLFLRLIRVPLAVLVLGTRTGAHDETTSVGDGRAWYADGTGCKGKRGVCVDILGDVGD